MINLQAFCHVGRSRTYLSQPYSIGDYTYASNGFVAVRVARQDDAPENDEAPKLIAEILSGHDARRFGPLPVFDIQSPRRVRCGECHGQGSYNDCDECGGSGEHECDHSGCQHTHECHECEGTGASQGEVDTSRPVIKCETCIGTGFKPDDRKLSPAENAMFKVYLWNKLAALPGVEVEHPIHGGTDRPLIFRFVGGYAALMGMRWSANTIGVIKPVQQGEAA